MILERWIMFVFKIIRSLIRNDYLKKKEKYIEKYNLKYSNYFSEHSFDEAV